MKNGVQEYMDYLHRIKSFREWIDTNCLFPDIPDSIVKPMRLACIEAEQRLVSLLYMMGQVERVLEIQSVVNLDVKRK